MKKRTSTPPSLSPAPSRKNLHSLSASPREIPCSAFTGISCASINPVRSISPASSLSTSTNRSEEHTSELQSHSDLVCRLLLEKKKKQKKYIYKITKYQHRTEIRQQKQ